MASSDDEGEPVPHIVSDYHFVDDNNEPISFSKLPLIWKEGESADGKTKQIFIHGTTDNGLQKIYKQVTAWKFNLLDAKPEILVLSKEKNWMKLHKPRKSYEDTIIRSILITLHCLHFVRKNRETSGRALWDHLSKVFRYEPRPSENDLVDHINLIGEAVKKDEVLAKSKYAVTFLDEKPWKMKALIEDVETKGKSGFIVDDITDDDEDDESDEEDFDSVCAICDNGGNLLCCEGECLRSFHATLEAGSESACESLGYSDEQVEAIQNFKCKNCQYKQHQCFACGELGNSDSSSSEVKVFRCVAGTCGRFYHPHCVSKLLHQNSEAEAENLREKIATGASFTCPYHKCCVCKQVETEKDPDMRFAMCRRCPTSYHRRCMPREIAFEESEDGAIMQRAWEGLMPKDRILIYCFAHKIDDEILTPIRNHIKFPGEKKKKLASELLTSREKVPLKKKNLILEDGSSKRNFVKTLIGGDKLPSTIKRGDSFKKREGISLGSESLKKHKVTNVSQKPFNKTISKLKSELDENKTSLGERLYQHAFANKGSDPVKSRKDDTGDGEKQTNVAKPVAKEISSFVPLDTESEKRILALMKDATSSITLAEVNEKHKVPTTHAYSSKYVVDKTITLGKVEGSVKALRAALQKLEEGGTIEDAKAVCGPGLLSQVLKWKNKLKVYLAPFLHGMRYTSFGRHFTKLDKLKKIVDILHLYAQDGDMIVDFCCGANDFSCLMKKKLDEVGKKCSYKNYDIIKPKNDFNFEKRDWMKVWPNELPAGSQLIMGLNPPFGVNAALANKFINKALEFKPKLIVLIVPQETERLDKKNSPYNLVFQDNELLAGKSFYLPGSVDVNDKQMDQWNMSPPPLSLWSRSDWTAKHKSIAQQHGHLCRVVDNHNGTNGLNIPRVVDGEISMPLDDQPARNDEAEKLPQRAASGAENHKEGLPRDNGGSQGYMGHGSGHNQFNKNPKKRSRGKGRQGSGLDEILPVVKKSRSPLPPDGKKSRSPPSPDRKKSRSPLPRQSQSIEKPSPTAAGMDSYQNFESRIPGPRQLGTGYTGNWEDNMVRSHGPNIEEPFQNPVYSARNTEQFLGYPRESVDNLGYRSSYMDDLLRQRSSYTVSHDPTFSTYGQMGSSVSDLSYTNRMSSSVSDLSYTNRMSTSTMQRYAPRLDELNHSRMNSLGPQQPPPPPTDRSGVYDPLAPPRPVYQSDSLGFAPGPYRPYSHNCSGGWLNE